MIFSQDPFLYSASHLVCVKIKSFILSQTAFRYSPPRSWYSVFSSFFFFFLNFGFLFIYLFTYLFMAVLGLCFCARAFSSCGKWGPLFIAVPGPLIIAASRCGAQAPGVQAQ